MTQIPEPDPQEKAETSSIGDLIGQVSKDFSTLLRQELELAKAELRQSATRAGKGAGLYGGAGVAGYMTVLFLSIALWWGLGYLVGNAWSALIVAAIWGIIALVMFLVGKRQMDAVKGMPQTVETVKEIPDALK